MIGSAGGNDPILGYDFG